MGRESVLETMSRLFGTRFWSVMTTVFLACVILFIGKGEMLWAVLSMAGAAVSESAWTRHSIRDELEDGDGL